MTQGAKGSGRRGRRWRLANRWHARRAVRSARGARFALPPEPRLIGSILRGRQILTGEVLIAGHLIEIADRDIWEVPSPVPAFDDARHGFTWLDDLAAVGTPEAAQLARAWTVSWLARFGRGKGPSWTPELAGQRIIGWINHAEMLEDDGDPTFRRGLSAQAEFLARRCHAVEPGPHRVEAHCALALAALSLEGFGGHLERALNGLSRACNSLLDASGGLASRNPEALMELFARLSMVAGALADAGRPPDPGLHATLANIAPTLRGLRHADGGLARFHGGGRGLEGRLDQAFAASGIRATNPAERAMGYVRLASGRTSVIADGDLPQTGPSATGSHASALAFEMTSGRRPLVVNCGTGASYGETWKQAGRQSASHSSLALDGLSFARFSPLDGGGAALVEGPGEVVAMTDHNRQVLRAALAHDGYRKTLGLLHRRQLNLTRDGRQVLGQDALEAETDQDRERLAQYLLDRRASDNWSLRFHLHPDVEAAADPGGGIVLRLPSGEVWDFDSTGSGTPVLEPSVFLGPGRLKPRATKQIVIHGALSEMLPRINWTFAKSQDTPQAIRDVVRKDDVPTS